MSKFDWARMYKDEEYLEREAYTCVETALCNHYDVEDVADITEAQWEDIHAWQEENVGEYSPMNTGFSDVYSYWEMERENREEV